jgi:hypothetical protein
MSRINRDPHSIMCHVAVSREMHEIEKQVKTLKLSGPLPNQKGKSLADFNKMMEDIDVAKFTGIFFSLVENMKSGTIDTKRCKIVLKKFDTMLNRAHEEFEAALPKLVEEERKLRKVDRGEDGNFVTVHTAIGKGASIATRVPKHLA